MTMFWQILISFMIPLSCFAENKIKLGLNWKPEPQFGGFYEALRTQQFQKNNLNVEIIPGGSGTPTIQMLLSGKLDYAIVSADEILLSHDRQSTEKVVALFAVYQKNPQILMVPKDSKIQSITQLFNSEYQIAAQSGLPYFQYLMKKNKSMKAKIVPYSGGIAPYLNMKQFAQQGFATSEPLLAEKAKKPANVFFIADEGYNPYTTVLAVNKKYLTRNKEQARSLVKIFRASWEDYIKNSNETNRLMNELNPSMDVESMNQSAQAQIQLIKTGQPIGLMTEKRWKELYQQLFDLQIIKSKMNIVEVFENL